VSGRKTETPRFCLKCGSKLGFRKRKGQWEPCNPDGSDHWDLCRELRYAEAMRGEYFEDLLINDPSMPYAQGVFVRARGWRAPTGKLFFTGWIHTVKGGRSGGKFYSGDAPPWE